ncbi:MAG: patatin-like phospholipase RssA [Mariprofundus sp.]|nr:patatin-like phospholipase RssA [Mariprofundus sp.]
MAAGKVSIGLALGSGSARGWAHIGVIHELAKLGIKPDIVCGSSVGALVGASLACGQLETLESWLRDLTVSDIIRLIDLSLTGSGLIQGNKLAQAFYHFVDDVDIETLHPNYGAIATDLDAGREVWFRSGSLLNAVRASIALPGLFPPIQDHGRWLVDGGLVNPVPVSMCRAMGADVVIAVNLNSELIGNKARANGRENRLALNLPQNELIQKIVDKLSPIRERIGNILPPDNETERPPGMFGTMTASIDIMQDRITKSRLAGDPPDILISPHLAHMGLLEFDRAEEAIEEGTAAVERTLASGGFRLLELKAKPRTNTQK